MPKSKRSIRRHHKRRMKAKARRIYISWWSDKGMDIHPKAHYYADNLALCSGYCCGNPRKWFKYKTRQEEAFELKAREQENEYFRRC